MSIFSNDFSKKPARSAALTAVFALCLGALAGCASGSASEVASTHSADKHEHNSAELLHTHEMWAKSAAKGEMTAIFGNLHSNLKDKELTIEKVTSEVAGAAEIHEVASGKMQPLANGLTLAAAAEVDLMPGGYHIMLMQLKQDLKAGDTVKFTLHFKGGKTQELSAEVRDYSGANEDYHGHDTSGHGSGEHGGHDHNSHEHDTNEHGANEHGHDH